VRWLNSVRLSLARAHTRLAPDRMDEAGERGEALALAAIQSPSGLRVPKSSQAGKHEIDLVVLTDTHLLAIEVKHWSGSIESDPTGRWIQAGAERKVHPDHLAVLNKKAEDLRLFLERQGQHLEAQSVVPWLLFSHPAAELGARLRAAPGLLTLAEVMPRLRRLLPQASSRWPARAWRALFGRTRSCSVGFQERKRALDRLPTWDWLDLRGGRRVKGDLRAFSLTLADGRVLQRRDLISLEVHAPQRLLTMVLRGVRVDWEGAAGARGGRGRVRPGQTLTLMLAGQGRELEVPLEAIERLRLGWQTEDYYASRP
jgi:Holliday junction resolvase-like predicted endonuclease